MNNRRVGHPIFNLFHSRNTTRGNEHRLPLILGIDETPEIHHTVFNGGIRVGWRGGPLVPAHLLKQSIADLAVAYRCASWRGCRQRCESMQEVGPADNPHQAALL